MPTIDSLDIQIKTSADTAEKSLDKLANTIGRISASLGGVNLTGFSVGVKNLSTAMQNLQNVKLPDYNRLAKGIERLGSINSAQIQQAGTAIRELGGSLRVLDGVNMSDNAVQLAELATAISRLGYTSSTRAIDNIPRLAMAMRQLMATLSTAPRVSQNLIDMTNALAKLSRTGSSSGRAATSLGKSLNLYTASTNRATKGTWSLAGAIGKMYATYWLLFRAFGKIGDAIDISSSLTEVQNVVDVTFGQYANLVEKMSDTSIVDFGMSELTVKQVASRFQAMGSAMGFAQGKMADMSIELTKLTADMASFYNVEQKDVAEDLESIFTGQTRPLRTYGLDLTEATLQEWALKQGLDANVNSMSQMEKTMLRYQYVMANTTAAQGDFLRTQDTWANQVRILKQNLEQLASVIGGTLINMLKPLVKALNNAMSHIIAFAQTVSEALGKIFGWKYEVGSGGLTSDLEDGEGAADGISDGIGNAADNAKKLKQQLQGFDELNVLRSDTGSSGGGSGTGGGAGGVGGGYDAGQWVEEETKWYDSSIDTLYKLGDYISQTLSRMMESIDWESIYEKARNFGKGLADFLNGLISPRLFGNVGKTIANSLNTAIYAALSFAETFDWTEFGESLAWGINDFFANFDFKSLAQTLNEFVDGLKEAVKGFFDTLDWSTVFDGIKDFLQEIELDTIGVIVGLVMLKKFGAIKIATAALGLITKPIATAIAAKLGIDLGSTTLFAGVASKLWVALGGAISAAGTSIATFGATVSNAISLAIAKMGGTAAIASAGMSIATWLGAGISSGIAGWNLGQWIYEKISGEEITMTFTEQMSEIKESFTDGTWKDAIELWGNDIYSAFVELGNAQAEFFNDVKNKISEMAGFVGDRFFEIRDKVVQTVSEFASKVVLKFTEINDGVKNRVLELKNNVSEAFDKIKEKISSIVEGIVNKFSDFKESIQNAINKIKDFFGFNNKSFSIKLPSLEGFTNGVKDLIEKLKELFGFNGKEVVVHTSVGDVEHGGGGGVRGNNVSSYTLDTSFYGTSYNGNLSGVSVSSATLSSFDSGISTVNSGTDYETKALLNEILSAIRNGQIIEVDGRELGRTVRNEDDAFYKRTGKGMFEHPRKALT